MSDIEKLFKETFDQEMRRGEALELDQAIRDTYNDGEIAGLMYAIWCLIELHEPQEAIKARLEEKMDSRAKAMNKRIENLEKRSRE